MAVGSEFKSSGITANTPKTVMLGAGTIHKGLTFAESAWNFEESLICATSGGSKLSIVPEFYDVPVDGALVNEVGELLYPVISWKCPRTAEVMKRVAEYMPQAKLNSISGVGEFAFNTIYKLIWLKENRPELLEQAHAWLFISNILAHRLTGVMATDRTMAGTSQMTDLVTGDWSTEILATLGIKKELFPPMVNAGDIIGTLTPAACELLGLPNAVPVVSTGHDTQFALFGSGVQENQPFLSSGTWEILMLRTAKASLETEDYAAGATVEYDSKAGLLNPGLQWIASGIIEWVKATCYNGENCGNPQYCRD